MKKVELSQYLHGVKPTLKKLIKILEKDFAYVSILGNDVLGTMYSVRKTVTSVSDSSWAERGFVVRVYADKRYYEYSFTNISEGTIAELAGEIIKNFREAAKVSSSIIDYPLIEEEAKHAKFEGTVKMLPNELTAGQIVGRLSSFKDKALNLSDKLIDYISALNICTVSKIFLSTKKDLEQSYVWSEGYCFAIVREGNNMKDSFISYSGLKGLELLDEMEGGVEKVVRKAERLLTAEPMVPGTYDIIFGPRAVGMIAHEAFGHGVEMDMFVKNRAQGAHYINKPVASEKVTMRDGAASAQHVSSYLFDDEGTLGTDTVVIKDGILKTGISDLLSALKLGTTPTGNGKRQSFERKAYTRMTNTFFTTGSDKTEDMIKSVKHGYLIMDASSGMEDPKDWGIQVMFEAAEEIVDGKLTGKIFSPVIMTGHVVELLKSISMVSDEFEIEGSGACGKGHKELVKVSTGGSYIKAKARLG